MSEIEEIEEAPRLGPACLVCGGKWTECPHDEHHVIDSLRQQLDGARRALTDIATRRDGEYLGEARDRMSEVAVAALRSIEGGGR